MSFTGHRGGHSQRAMGGHWTPSPLSGSPHTPLYARGAVAPTRGVGVDTHSGHRVSSVQRAVVRPLSLRVLPNLFDRNRDTGRLSPPANESFLSLAHPFRAPGGAP